MQDRVTQGKSGVDGGGILRNYKDGGVKPPLQGLGGGDCLETVGEAGSFGGMRDVFAGFLAAEARSGEDFRGIGKE
jgi:hypothetical protein